ncbi:hypothetical protein TNCV_4383341 [Trichonephila clavipes]|nr:hypothetical protein TNCV_4383341 [Trichonephila clavipes]
MKNLNGMEAAWRYGGVAFCCWKIAPGWHVMKATRGLLATDLVILNHDQLKRTTPELEPPSPNYHTAPMRRLLSLDRFNVHQWVFVGTRLKLMTRQPRVHYLGH